MADQCQFEDCDKPAFDECVNCGDTFCKKHGKDVRGSFVCLECMEEYLEDETELEEDDEEYG